MAVAEDAGVGGQPCFVSGNELPDHMPLKFRLKIEKVVGNPQLVGNSLGIHGILLAAAAKMMEPHGASGAVKLLLQHQTGCHAAVNTAAHANEGFLFCHICGLLCLFFRV